MKPNSIPTQLLLKNLLLLAILATSLLCSQSSSAQIGCATCALGYPDNSNLPKSAVIFNESQVLAAWEPAPGNCSAPTQIKLWYTDEHALTLGVRRVIVKTSGGTTTTDYPITPTPASPTCVINPLVGTTIATGDQSGNDVADGGGRPLWPALFITDLTVNGASSRIGDWQQGGIGVPPHRVCGTWKGAVRTVDKTKNPVQVTVTPDSDPAKNNWNLGGGDAPPAGTDDEGYGAEVVWDISALGLIPGHTYRLQFMVHDGDQNKDGGDVGEACTTLIVATPPVYNPDFNSTFVNVPVPGDVNTNDKVPAGTTYGTSPTLVSSPAGSSPVLTMNSNGTYSFVSNLPGVYTYNVPVCVPGQVAPCPNSALVITVLNSFINTNPPVANVDIATTKINTAVTLKSLANDAPGSATTLLVPSSVSVTVAPLHGTASVNTSNGDITYTPAAGYTGPDTLTYQVCDNQVPAKCASAKQIITVKANDGANTTIAADDYKITQINTAATGNVKTNDSDPEGDVQTVTTQNTTVAGKGTLVLASDGSYTFTPVTGFTGPVDFPYTTCDNGTPQACASATLHVLVRPDLPVINPDFNSTFVNVPVPGNVNTNDKVPAGTTYGTSPTLVSSPAGSSPVLTMSSSGNYSFVSNLPGVYTYNVPVCVPGQVAPCPPSALVITVLNSLVNTNPPVANVDIATTRINTAVTLKSLANDAAGSATTLLVPSSVTVTAAPLHGTTSVNTSNGDITYTPAAGYVGPDTLTYQVCDNQSPAKCATAKQIITVLPNGATNTTVAADDYKITQINTTATGNVKTNDSDPEGNTQTVTTQTTTLFGKGTLILAADGSYTFIPVTGYIGPVDFPYTTCDNGTPQACASATLHILVRPETPVINPDFNSTFVNVPVPGNVNTNDQVPAGTTYGTSPTLVSSPAGSSPALTMNSNGTYSFVSNLPGVYTYNVPVCVPGQVAPCPPSALVITVLNSLISTNPPVANVDIATTKIGVAVTLKSLANDAPGNATTLLVPSSVTVTTAPLHGTTSVNTSNGDITYTPAAGYTGPDTLTYQVCDNQSPAKCASAKQIITVLPNGTTNTTVAADDYKITQINTAATGNVKTNDSDPEGNSQTVTTQNTTVAGKGTLVLAADGSYTFTPVTGYTGPVDFPYTTCDNGTPQACASATLHVLVRPLAPQPNLTPTIEFIPNISHGITTLGVVTSVYEIKNNPTNGLIEVFVTKDPKYTITYSPASTIIGGRSVNNGVWTFDNSNPLFYIFRTTSVIPGNGVSSFGFSVSFNPNSSNGQTTISAFITTNSGGEASSDAGDNHDDDILIYFLN